jgi:hypothetical protein
MNVKSLLFFLIYLFFSLILQVLILKNNDFSKSQKKVHSIMLWLIPFVWGILLLTSMRLLQKKIKPSKENKHDSAYQDNCQNLTSTIDTHQLL